MVVTRILSFLTQQHESIKTTYTMLSFLRFSTLAIQAVVVAAEFAPCPILGPWFPKPTSLLTSPAIKSGLQDLTDILDSNVATGNGTHGPTTPNTTSFSIVLFSTAEGSTLPNEPFFYEYHHTAPTLRNATTGVNTVDKDSIYRIGDLTQIFTVWTFLNEVGDASWDEPVTKYVPELATAPKGDRLDFVDWHDVRLGDLAGQLAGIARDCEFPRNIARGSNVNYL